ncbi:hypothetical protein FQZ97_308370 [compost metagenome]
MHTQSTRVAIVYHSGYGHTAKQANADESADVVPPLADLRTAEHLGARVAEVAQQLVAGRRALAELKQAA